MFLRGIHAKNAFDDIAPLREQASTEIGPSGESIANGETIASGWGQAVEANLPNHRLLFAFSGQSSSLYSRLKKGGASGRFELGVAQLKAAKALADNSKKLFTPRCVAVVHGEADSFENPNYYNSLLEWQSDYSAAAGTNVPFLLCQMCGWHSVGSSSVANPIHPVPQQQWQIAIDNPTKFICVGPKYALEFLPDGLHMSAQGTKNLGKYFEKAYRALVSGQAFRPLYPTAVTKAGTTVTATFNVPTGMLAFDTTAVTDPGNRGFEILDASNTKLTISSVTLNPANNQVVIAVASGVPARLRYAWTGTPGQPAGPTAGARGNLRDSDSLPNWCVHFDMPIS